MSREITEKRNYLKYISIVMLVVGVILCAFYTTGYRLNKNFSIVKAGSVIIEVPEAGTRIYLDALKKKTTSKPNESVSFSSLYPKEYTVIVAKDGFYPWKKEFRIEEDRIVHLKPFLIPNTTSGAIITEEDPEYEKIQSLIDDNNVQWNTEKKTSKDGLVVLWIEDDTVYAKWLGDEKTTPQAFCTESSCATQVEVMKSLVPVRSLDFYDDRDDVIIAAAGDSVFAVELDRNGTQNFEPLYKGKKPEFAKNALGSIFIRDVETLMELKL